MISRKELEKLIEEEATIYTSNEQEIKLDSTYDIYRDTYTQYDGDQWLTQCRNEFYIAPLKKLFKEAPNEMRR